MGRYLLITTLVPSIFPQINTMKALLRFCLLSVCLSLGVRADNSADKSSDAGVQASSDFRVAILDNGRASIERTALHEAFAASLSKSMTKECGGAVNVKVTEVDAFTLAFEMKTGSYDAAFIVGNNVPPELRKGDYEILRASTDGQGRVFYMVIPTADASLEKMVAASFPEALAADKFQDAIVHAVAIHVNTNAIKLAAKESVADSTR